MRLASWTLLMVALELGCSRPPGPNDLRSDLPSSVDAERLDGGIDAAGVDADPDGADAAFHPSPPCSTPLRFAGNFCGPGGTACRLTTDRISSEGSTNGAPSIATGPDDRPVILYSSNVGGITGYYAELSSSWNSTVTPFGLIRGWTGFEGTSALALVCFYDPADNNLNDLRVGLYRRDANGFSLIERLPWSCVGSQQVAGSSTGCLDAVVGFSDSLVHYRRPPGGSWSVQAELSTPLGMNGYRRIARAPSGDVHLFSWHFYPTPLEWQIIGQTAETLTTDLVGELAGGVLLQGGAEVPVAAYTATTGDRLGTQELRLAIRDRSGTWSHSVLEEGRVSACPEPTEGATCAVDALSWVPVAVAASSSGDARIVYGRVHHTGVLFGHCGREPGGPRCTWEGRLLKTGELVIATLAGAKESFPSPPIMSATAEVDTQGRIHIAAYTEPFSTETHYFRFEP